MSDGYIPPVNLGYSTDPTMFMEQSEIANRSASPAVIILLTVIILMYYIIFYVFGVDVPKPQRGSSLGETALEVIMWSLLACLMCSF